MDEYDRKFLRGLLHMTDEKTEDVLRRTIKMLDESYGIIFYAQDVAYVIEAWEKAKADAWKDSR